MTAVNPYEAEIHQLESQGVHVIYGTDRGSPPLPALDAEHAAVREGVQALLHSSSQLTIERRLAPHADQLVFTTRNDDDVITLRRHVPGALETLVATRARSITKSTASFPPPRNRPWYSSHKAAQTLCRLMTASNPPSLWIPAKATTLLSVLRPSPTFPPGRAMTA